MRKRVTALGIVIVVAVMLVFAFKLGRHGLHSAARVPSESAAAAAALSDADILFLEALRRGYALDDLVVRRELVRRMRDTLVQEHPVPTPDDAALGAWLTQHADRYRAPARYSFDQVYLSRGRHGASLPGVAASVAAKLRAAPADFRQLGDPFPRGGHVDRFNRAQIEANFGRAVAQAVASMPTQQWQGPVQSPLGLHFIRVTAVEAARTLTLDEARARVRIDAQQAQQQQLVRETLLRLRADFSGAAPLPPPTPMQDEDMP